MEESAVVALNQASSVIEPLSPAGRAGISEDRVLLFTIEGGGSFPNVQVYTDCLLGQCIVVPTILGRI